MATNDKEKIAQSKARYFRKLEPFRNMPDRAICKAKRYCATFVVLDVGRDVIDEWFDEWLAMGDDE